MNKLECTLGELKEVEAVLGRCSGLPGPRCAFCDCAGAVLILIRQREELKAERDHLRKLVDCARYFQEHVPEEKP